MKVRWPSLNLPPINLWTAPHQPALEDTMTEAAERDSVQDQLCSRIDDLELEKEALTAQLDRAEEELEALAAHVGRLSEALRKIDADLEGRNFLENSSLRDTARAAIEVLPSTSLPRLKAKWQAEAMEGWLEQVRYMEGLNTFDCIESAELYAEELHSQAERKNGEDPRQ